IPPSAVGTNSFAGQATTHSRVLQSAHTAPSTTMCACSLTSKRVVPMRSSNPTSGHSLTGAPSTLATGDQRSPRRSTSERKDRNAGSLARRLAHSPERPPAGEAVADEVAAADPEALALPPEQRAQPGLGPRVVDAEHPLDDAG